MGEKLVIGPINKGLKLDREPFFIDNDSFPKLLNAYQWRGRVKRKRGTRFLTHLNIFFDSSSLQYNPSGFILTLSAISGTGSLFITFSISNASIVPSSVTIVGVIHTYTDDGLGNLINGVTVYGTINYVTGVIAIPIEANNTVTASFLYYQNLPVMGLRQLQIDTSGFPGNLAFDTVYSYNILPQAPPTPNYNVSFYKNPGSAAPYVQKTIWSQAIWHGLDYQQFWTLNYENALFATNGITIPFTTTNIGMQFKPIKGITFAVGPPYTVNLHIIAHGLLVGDFVYINEVSNTMTGINFQTGYVTTVIGVDDVTVTLPNAIVAGAWTSGGIAQYLTSSVPFPSKDCIRWYDGDPTNGSATAPVLLPGKGWVNFMPPLSQAPFSIAGLPQAIYYLVGGRMLQSFKDRLVVIGPVVQTSQTNAPPIYLQDTIIYSQNGTPYYTSSYPADPLNQAAPTSVNTFQPILVPANQIATASAWFADSTGFGGNIQLGINQKINTSSTNEDVLILGCDTKQVRMVYSGNDVQPFNFYIVNAELGSSSTFSVINMDQAVITRGTRGYILSSQTEVQRFDLDIPDIVFEMRLTNNGTERITATRDFQLEWVYFSYPSDSISWNFNTQTLLYNYRDHSWGVFNETYTSYGIFQSNTQVTWASWIEPWSQYADPWNSGIGEAGDPLIIAGNTQGYVVIRDTGTGESISLSIQSISGNTITSPNHCLNNGDFIAISGVLGSYSQFLNNRLFQVINVTTNTFKLNPPIPSGVYNYHGLGVITRYYIPQIQTKQFPMAWGMSKKTRLGVQQYLLTTTLVSQITLLIFLSQNGSSGYNDSMVVPAPNTINNSLVYSSVLYTCPESTNLGLTPANINLQMVTAEQQQQIWHRLNTSLIGDTVQLGFTISDAQMTMLYPIQAGINISGASQTYPCILTCAATYLVGTILQITGVLGMTQLNYVAALNNIWVVTASDGVHVTIDCDATAFGAFVSPTPPQIYGIATPVNYLNHAAEIELHGAIIDVTPSQMLA